MRFRGLVRAALALLLWWGMLLPRAAALGDGDGFVATLWGPWTREQAFEVNAMAARAGARQISYLVHMRQRDRGASEVRWLGSAPGTPLWAAPAAPVLRDAIADARGRGLAVTLVPFLFADSGEARQWFWPRDRARWFASYGERMEELAEFAARHGVSELLVASELSLLYLDEAGWRGVIGRVRARFSGHLTISTLFYEYATIRFWDALDSIGVSAYFPLAFWTGIRGTDWLERAWRLHHAHLVAFAAALGKPITFAEVGYPATHVAAVQPWDYRWAERRLDPELQARCFEALRRVWSREPRLRRLSIWGLEPAALDARHSGGKGYLPLGKPAESPVRRLFAERAAP
ncbi:MAG: hypothetical protein KatS3mg102_2245 [Planctomycetota bacterium]|nr:MAG: hypothetical protein KatS3mg102_2245 [Planctomycetota bacterium]